MSGTRVTPAWLTLREPSDAAARSSELVDELRRWLPRDRPLTIHDLGCGTGSMLRWLAPRLDGPQQWVCYDLDDDLLALTAGERHHHAADGSPVGVTVRNRDVTRLDAAECAGAALITTSALLDLLTDDDLDRLVATCLTVGCPALLTLSVVGRVALWPPHPLDTALAAAFNAHQRRPVDGRRLLGPDAADRVARAFQGGGYAVVSRATPWRLGPAQRELCLEWFTGWVAAACEQCPELRTATSGYRKQRVGEIEQGRLRVVVGHRDVLARPRAVAG